MNPQEERESRAWVAAWREKAGLLEEVRARELRALTEGQVGQMFVDMVFDTDLLWISPERAGAAGLVEQQRLFMRSHEHPARHRRRP